MKSNQVSFVDPKKVYDDRNNQIKAKVEEEKKVKGEETKNEPLKNKEPMKPPIDG